MPAPPDSPPALTLLFFGSFNPVHVGHLILAEHALGRAEIAEVWLVVSPQNPHKAKATLLDQYLRLDLVHRALAAATGMRPSDIEFGLPQPSYTVNTLAYLAEKHPAKRFALLMGQDNLESLPRWRNHEHILEHYPVYVYPRLSADGTRAPLPALAAHSGIHLLDAPIIELSSTAIRQALKAGRSVRYLLPAGLYDYITKEQLYT